MQKIVSQGLDFLRHDCQIICRFSVETYKLSFKNSASIGAHMRHILEFLQILTQNICQAEIDYEKRARILIYETDPQAALQAFEDVFAAFEKMLIQYPLETKLHIKNFAGYGLPYITNISTFGREILYVMEHATHHFAVIQMITKSHNIHLPAGFGVAPSTRIFNDNQPHKIAQ